MNSKMSSGDAALEVRNVVVVGPGGSGKTTVIETLLNTVGATTRVGRVEDGTTVMDFEDVEKRLQYSVNLSVASVDVTDSALVGDKGMVRLNLLDSPGNPDFVGELRAGLRGCDAALFVISASDGIDGATRRVWNECSDVGTPRAIVVTDVDEENADFSATLAELKEQFGSGVHPLYLPYEAKDPKTAAIISVVQGKVMRGFGPNATFEDIPGDLADEVEELRGALIEDVITEAGNEELMERYLEGEEFNFEALADDLTTATTRAQFFPVLPMVATTGLGVKQLLRVICTGFPTPADHGLLKAYTPAGGDREVISHNADGPLIAQVIKTITDPFVGRISVVRMFSGVLKEDQVVHISGHAAGFAGRSADDSWHVDHDEDEKIGALARPMGDTQVPIKEARAGEIVTIARLSKAETGDTISHPDDPAVVMTWDMPVPLFPTAIKAAKQADEGKLMQALQRLQAEDPSVHIEVHPTTGQLLMWTMGEQHFTVMQERLRARGGLEIETFPVQVPLKETLSGKSEVTGKHVKQSGGHGQYAVAELRFAPLPQGSGFEFVDEVVGGAVPKNYIPSVQKGIEAQMAKGITGYPMVDIQATLYHGKAHSVDSSDAAFQMAGSLGLQEAAKRSGITILEPIDSVEIVCDDDFVGNVMSDLSSRRGRLKGSEPAREGQTKITADVPAFELIRYATILRSLTRGTGSFTREYQGHEAAPSHLTDKLVAGA